MWLCVVVFVGACLFVCVCHGLKRKKKLKIEDKLFPSPYYFSGENSDGVMNSRFLHILCCCFGAEDGNYSKIKKKKCIR